MKKAADKRDRLVSSSNIKGLLKNGLAEGAGGEVGDFIGIWSFDEAGAKVGIE